MRVWLLRVRKDGEVVTVKADNTADVAVALAFAADVLAKDEAVPPEIREAADRLVDAIRGGGPRTPLIYPKKGPPGSAA